MAGRIGLNIVKDGLVFYLDVSNQKCYISGSASGSNLGKNSYNLSLNTTYVQYTSSNNGIWQFLGSGSVSQGVIISNLAPLLSSANTVEFSIYPTSNNCGQILANALDGFTGTYYSYGEGSRVYDKNGVNLVNFNWTNNSWNYLTTTFDGVNTITTYKNSQFVASASNMDFSGLTGNLSLGARGWAPYNQNFKLGLVKIYNRILSQQEILQNYTAEKGRFGL